MRCLLDTNACAALIGGETQVANDIWIAAQAMETGSELLSYDEHFARVAGLAWTVLRR